MFSSVSICTVVQLYRNIDAQVYSCTVVQLNSRRIVQFLIKQLNSGAAEQLYSINMYNCKVVQL